MWATETIPAIKYPCYVYMAKCNSTGDIFVSKKGKSIFATQSALSNALRYGADKKGYTVSKYPINYCEAEFMYETSKQGANA